MCRVRLTAQPKEPIASRTMARPFCNCLLIDRNPLENPTSFKLTEGFRECQIDEKMERVSLLRIPRLPMEKTPLSHRKPVRGGRIQERILIGLLLCKKDGNRGIRTDFERYDFAGSRQRVRVYGSLSKV